MTGRLERSPETFPPRSLPVFGMINERINRIDKPINHIPMYTIKRVVEVDERDLSKEVEIHEPG